MSLAAATPPRNGLASAFLCRSAEAFHVSALPDLVSLHMLVGGVVEAARGTTMRMPFLAGMQDPRLEEGPSSCGSASGVRAALVVMLMMMMMMVVEVTQVREEMEVMVGLENLPALARKIDPTALLATALLSS
jgi:hypothetical protein